MSISNTVVCHLLKPLAAESQRTWTGSGRYAPPGLWGEALPTSGVAGLCRGPPFQLLTWGCTLRAVFVPAIDAKTRNRNRDFFILKHQSKVWHGGLIVTWIARMSVKFALNRSRILISSWPINNCILSLNIKANEANFTSGSSHLRSHSTLARFHMMNCHTKSGGENDFYSSIWRKLVF